MPEIQQIRYTTIEMLQTKRIGEDASQSHAYDKLIMRAKLTVIPRIKALFYSQM